jgi:hypothetical protein
VNRPGNLGGHGLHQTGSRQTEGSRAPPVQAQPRLPTPSVRRSLTWRSYVEASRGDARRKCEGMTLGLLGSHLLQVRKQVR